MNIAPLSASAEQLAQKLQKELSRHWYVYGIIVIAALVALLGWASGRVEPLYVIGTLGAILLVILILRNPWHGMYAVAFFIPFERLGSVDIAGATVRPSQVTALLTIVAMFLYFTRVRKLQIPPNPTALPLVLFLAVSVLGLFNAWDLNLRRSIIVLLFITFTFFVSWLVPFLVDSKHHLDKVLRFLFASLFVVTLFGIFQFLGDLAGLPPEITGLRELYTKEILGFPRVQSTALEPLYFANYLLIPLSILLAFFFTKDKLINPFHVVVLLGLGILNLLLTVARGGYAAFFVSAVIVTAYYFFQLKLITWRTAGYVAAIVGIALIALIQLISLDVVSTNFLGHVSNPFEGASFNERVEMYEIAINAWGDHPLVGIGPGSFGPYASHHPMVVPEHGWNIVNNEYLELLAEHGILGLTLMAIVFITVLIRSVKALVVAKDTHIKAVLIGLFAAFCGILFQYNTFSILYIVHIWFTIGLLIAVQNMVLYPGVGNSANKAYKK